MAGVSPIELQKALSGVEYPADRDRLTKAARDNGAPEELRDRISHLDKDRFDNPAEVSKAVFGEK